VCAKSNQNKARDLVARRARGSSYQSVKGHSVALRFVYFDYELMQEIIIIPFVSFQIHLFLPSFHVFVFILREAWGGLIENLDNLRTLPLAPGPTLT